MFFDTHAHYDDAAFNEDRDALLTELLSGDVELIIDPGCTVDGSRQALAIAERYPNIYAAVGIHPEELESLNHSTLDDIRHLAGHPKCVAIGEIGLDYYWDDTHKAEQKELFEKQLKLACELDLPVIIHDREAHGDCLEIVGKYDNLRGVFHCYSGSAEMAKELLKRGWYLGFDGPVTYKNAKKALEVLEICPLERILLETDSPYLSPVPLRGKRNNSANLRYVAKKIAEIKNKTPEEIALTALKNGKRLFNIS